MPSPYALAIALFSQGQLIHLEPVGVEPVQRAARSLQFSAGPDSALWSGALVESYPLGLPRCLNGPVRCDGVRLCLRSGGWGYVFDLPPDAFGPTARAVMRRLVQAGALAVETAHWELIALPDATQARYVMPGAWVLPPVQARQGQRPPIATALQPELDAVEDMPVYLAEAALTEAMQFGRQFPDRESGGVFFGQVVCDDAGAFAVARTFAPAGDAPADAVSMRFDRQAWEHIHRARQVSAHPEAGVVAWFHTHPALTPADAPREPLLAPSSNDLAIQAAHFPDPYLLCLIADAIIETLSAALLAWGWDRYGVTLRPRTFYIY